jgi:1,2-diacylglycerol 3-alpha-glucosyltransferase
MRRPRLIPASAVLLLAAVASACLGEQLWPKTVPGVSGDLAQPFTFAVMGDNRGSPVPDVYLEIIKQINTSDARFVINTGDIVPGDADLAKTGTQLDAFLQATAVLNPPMYVTYGNHEERSLAHLEMLEQRIGPRYFAFTFGNSRFYMLNTELVGGQIVGEQLRWLAADLAGEGQRAEHRFVFLHRPLYSPLNDTGKRGWGDAENLSLLQGLFVDDKVDMVFSGHDHYFSWRVVEGVTHITTGGGGAPLYVGPGALSINHYLLVKVDGSQVLVDFRPILPPPAKP